MILSKKSSEMVHYSWSYVYLKFGCPILFSSIWTMHDVLAWSVTWSLMYMKQGFVWCNWFWFLECFWIFWNLCMKFMQSSSSTYEDHERFQIRFEFATNLLPMFMISYDLLGIVSRLRVEPKHCRFGEARKIWIWQGFESHRRRFFKLHPFSHVSLHILPCLFTFWFQIFPNFIKS